MKWLRKLVLTETLEQRAPDTKMWFVCTKTGKDETGSGLDPDRPTTYDAALREAAKQKDVVYVLPRDNTRAL